MATIACPYCYRHIDQRRLAYQCLGLGVPGGVRCMRSVDETRAELTNVRASSFPTFAAPGGGRRGVQRKAPCPHCGGPTGVRACPVCHSPLSAAFAESRSPWSGWSVARAPARRSTCRCCTTSCAPRCAAGSPPTSG